MAGPAQQQGDEPHDSGTCQHGKPQGGRISQGSAPNIL